VTDAVVLRLEPDLQRLRVSLQRQVDPVTFPAQRQSVVVRTEDRYRIAPTSAALLSSSDGKGIASEDDRRAGVNR
jgi:hypothetical protein